MAPGLSSRSTSTLPLASSNANFASYAGPVKPAKPLPFQVSSRASTAGRAIGPSPGVGQTGAHGAASSGDSVQSSSSPSQSSAAPGYWVGSSSLQSPSQIVKPSPSRSISSAVCGQIGDAQSLPIASPQTSKAPG
jgi:hypothetical protein